MQASPLPLTRDLVLIGGGHTNALVLRKWGMAPLSGVRVTLINPGPTAPYTGMLPGFVAGHYSRDALNIDLVKLARFANARLITDFATGIDREARTVTLQSGRTVPYHALAIDIGVSSLPSKITGASKHAIAAKPMDVFANRWTAFKDRLIRGAVKPNIAVIGGGVAGVELALAMKFAIQSGVQKTSLITLIDDTNILSHINLSSRQSLISALEKAEIQVIDHQRILSIENDRVRLVDGQEILSAFTVTTAGATPYDWLDQTGLDLHDGFIKVGPSLESTNTDGVFAAGDCAHLTHAPRPKAGVFAVRQAPVLFDNLRAILSGGSVRDYVPQKDYLKLISLGGKSAVATKWDKSLKGRLIWRWKDQIDRRFMAQFDCLEPMAQSAIPKHHALGMTEALGPKPLCGGCGAKVGNLALQSALAKIPPTKRKDVLSSPGDDAAILKGPNGMKQVITTDHLRSFVQDPWLMARITTLHALGDIWAMGAQPQAATVNLTLPRMSLELQETTVSELIASCSAALTDVGAELVGGHTSMGAEFSIGLTITGLCKTPITLSGAKDGDALILTRPIGSGTILAAEMALQAKGEWVEAALTEMATSQHQVAEILAHANAMTDVTGFGLAGHAAAMAQASGMSMVLDLDRIPFFNGAIELCDQGVRSSIYNDNRSLVGELDPEGSARTALLFDPQTSGGLLAAVPDEKAQDLVDQIVSLGATAAIIGRCSGDTNKGRVRLAKA